jgi:hypothetical protein
MSSEKLTIKEKENIMNSNRIIRLSGWALMLGGLATAAGFVAGEGGVFVSLFLVAPIFLGTGMFGLAAGYGDEIGRLGKGVLWAGVLGAAVALGGAVGQILGDEGYFLGTFAGLTLIFSSLLVFGVVALRRKLLPWGNALPVVAGIWVPLIALLYIVSEAFEVRLPDLPDPVLVGVFVFMGAVLLLWGYLVQADARRERAVA